jgi:hypothetical protein
MPDTKAASVAALLANMEQVACWLPARDSGRDALIRSVAQMKQRLEGEPLSKSEVVDFQMQVWRLTPNRFKTLLNRRVAEFAALYGVDVLNPERRHL